jgi:virginiamycin B lyase
VRIWTRALLTAASVLALVPAGAMAAPALSPTSYDPDGDPEQLTLGPDGNVWAALSANPANHEFARINQDGTFTYADTQADHTIVGLTTGPDVAGGPNNRIWISYNGGVSKYDPVTNTATDFPIAGLDTAQGITHDADGNIWVVDSGATPGVIKIAPTGAKIDDVPVAASNGRGVALGSDGRIWWVDFTSGDIHATNKDAPYTTTTYDAGAGSPQQIAAGPAGQLGYSYASNAIGRITTDGVPANTTATGTDAFGVTFGRDGSYWIAEFLKDKLVRLSPDGTSTEPITLPAGTFPRYVAADAHDNIWVQSSMGTKLIYKVTGVEAPPPPQTTDPGNGGTGPTGPTGNGPTGPSVTPDTAAPLLSRAKVDTKKRRLTITLDEPAALQLTIQQKVKRGKKNVWKRIRPVIKKQGKVGVNTISLGKKFKKGTYRVQVTATDVLGNKTKSPKTAGFKVK